MTIIGFIIILSVVVSYFAMMFLFHRFIYKTWIFDIGVVIGMVIGFANWLQASDSQFPWGTVTLGIIWFLVSRIELKLIGSKELNLHVGDKYPRWLL